MYLESRLLFIYVETPLHTGAGAGVEAIDLPVQRERTTGYPMAQAPGIKGALRSEVIEKKKDEKKGEVTVVFGPDTSGGNDNLLHAGAFSPGDGRILLFPVRSLKGVFAWTTNLDVLQRWQREATAAGFTHLPQLPNSEPAPNLCYTSGNGATVDGNVVLEEFAYQVNTDVNIKPLAQWLAKYALPDHPAYKWWKEQLPEKLIILPNDDFRDFTQYATEVLTRIRLSPDTKTVQKGALWTEEHLPPDTLLFAPVRATRFRVTAKEIKNLTVPPTWKDLLEKQDAQPQAQTILDWVSNKDNIPHRLQLGGDETTGRGIISLRWLKASEVKENGK